MRTHLQPSHPMLLSLTWLLSSWLVAACAGTPHRTAAPVDVEAIRGADRAYATAWLANDPEAVMATLTEAPVLMPSGVAALVGRQAAREFWWPEGGAPTTVHEFDVVQEEAGGAGDLGFVRGSFTLGFEFGGESYRSGGEYLSVLRRTADGWRLSHRSWNDLWRTP